jgi:peptide/nickel transport system substrate-binding protein
MLGDRLTRRRFLQRSSLALAGAATLSTLPRLRAEAAPATGGTLTIARPVDSISLDPYRDSSAPGTWVYGLIYDSLVTLGTDMTVQPGLASSWRVLSPSKVRFSLRHGVQFQDGTPCNAAAVKFNFDRTFNAKTPGIWASFAGPIAGATVVDDYTVDVESTEPFAPLLVNLAVVHGAMASPDAVRKQGDAFGRHPVGTGPFKFVEWVPNDHITLARNDAYWGPKPNLDRIVFRIMPEEEARMIALRNGEVDMVLLPSLTQLPSLARDSNYTIASVTGTRTVFIACTLTQPPMDDVRVRRALMIGTDRKSIVDNLVGPAGTLANDMMAPDIFGYAPQHLDTRYPHDAKGAVAMLAEAGFRPGPGGVLARDGVPLTLSMMSSRGRYPKDAEISEAFQAQMRDLGVRVDVQTPEYAVVFSTLRAPTLNVPLMMSAWGNITGDADHTLVTTARSDQVPPRGWNAFRYLNPQYDAVVNQARTSVNSAQRRALYAQAQGMLARDLPYFPIYNMNNIAAMRSYVKGFVPHPVEYVLRVGLVWLQK